MKQPLITDYIQDGVSYDNHGTYFWAKQKNGGVKMLADMRGWGAIQNMCKMPSGKIDMDLAMKFQDELGQFIADAINEKLERLKKEQP